MPDHYIVTADGSPSSDRSTAPAYPRSTWHSPIPFLALFRCAPTALLEALYHNGDGGIEFRRAMTKDSAVLRRDFETGGEGDPISIQVKPSDILPFIEKNSLVEHRRSFKREEIDRLVDIVALLRLGAGLHAGKLTAGQPVGEDSIRRTIDMIARSVAESRKIPAPVNPNLKARSAFKVEPWSARLRLLLAGGRDKDYIVMEPITPDKGFESGAAVSEMISVTGYAGRIWIIEPSGELAHDLGPAERQDVAAVAESVSEDEKIRRLGSVVTIGGMVEWVEDFLGAEVSRESVFYSISPQRIVPLVTHLASMCGEVGREFFARLASGAEAMARDVETEVRGFSVGVKVAPEILLRFLNDSKDRDGALSSFSVVAHTELIDILASLRADWYSFVEEGRKIKGRMNEGLLKETERAVARHTGKYGTMPRPVTFRLDEGEWSTAMVMEHLGEELHAHPETPFVFIIGPSPAGTVDRNALNKMIAATGFKSWFILANVDGKTLYDSLE